LQAVVASKPALAVPKTAAAGKPAASKPALVPVAGGKPSIVLAGGAKKPAVPAKAKTASKKGDDDEGETKSKKSKKEAKDTGPKRPPVRCLRLRLRVFSDLVCSLQTPYNMWLKENRVNIKEANKEITDKTELTALMKEKWEALSAEKKKVRAPFWSAGVLTLAALCGQVYVDRNAKMTIQYKQLKAVFDKEHPKEKKSGKGGDAAPKAPKVGLFRSLCSSR
jgi:hypothetical protein